MEEKTEALLNATNALDSQVKYLVANLAAFSSVDPSGLRLEFRDPPSSSFVSPDHQAKQPILQDKSIWVTAGGIILFSLLTYKFL
jgi:hypothetical protein